MKFFVLFLILISSTFSRAEIKKDIKILSNQLSFKYISSDGSFSLSCKHWTNQSDLNDWNVYCGKGTKWKKQFLVHLILRQHTRNDNSASLEILYWVTDRNAPMPKFTGNSQSINFKSLSDISGLTLMQSIENDYSQLELSYNNYE